MTLNLPLDCRSHGTQLQPAGDRLALCTFSSGSAVAERDGLVTLDPAGADLSVMNSGGAGLFEEHFRTVDRIIGAVREAWRTDAGFDAIVQFARRPQALELLELLQDGMPLNCSMGYSITEVEEQKAGGLTHWVARRWQPYEISIVCRGADPGARFHANLDCAELAEMLDRKRSARLDRERTQRIEQLRAPAWRPWATNGACDELSTALALPADRIRGALVPLVEQHLA
jgi:hypothetical protein